MNAFRVNLVTSYPYDVNQLARQVGEKRIKAINLELKVNASGEFDLVIVCNYPRRPLWVKCPEDSLVKLIQEPVLNGYWYNFTRRSSKKYAEVYGGHTGGFGFLPWHVSLGFDDLIELRPEPKNKLVSMIASTKRDLEGHRFRDDLVHDLKNLVPGIDFFGKGREFPLAQKDDGLRSYKYSIAVENSSQFGYWTEKFMDPLLLWTKPIYSGCPDISKVLPFESFSMVPYEMVKNPDEYAKRLADALQIEPNLKSLSDARNLILNEYSLGAFIFNAAQKRIGQGGQSGRRRSFLLLDMLTLGSLLRDFLLHLFMALRGKGKSNVKP